MTFYNDFLKNEEERWVSYKEGEKKDKDEVEAEQEGEGEEEIAYLSLVQIVVWRILDGSYEGSLLLLLILVLLVLFFLDPLIFLVPSSGSRFFLAKNNQQKNFACTFFVSHVRFLISGSSFFKPLSVSNTILTTKYFNLTALPTANTGMSHTFYSSSFELRSLGWRFISGPSKKKTSLPSFLSSLRFPSLLTFPYTFSLTLTLPGIFCSTSSTPPSRLACNSPSSTAVVYAYAYQQDANLVWYPLLPNQVNGIATITLNDYFGFGNNAVQAAINKSLLQCSLLESHLLMVTHFMATVLSIMLVCCLLPLFLLFPSTHTDSHYLVLSFI
jgi:hypothetical protein